MSWVLALAAAIYAAEQRSSVVGVGLVWGDWCSKRLSELPTTCKRHGLHAAQCAALQGQVFSLQSLKGSRRS